MEIVFNKQDWIKSIIDGKKGLPVPQQWMSFFNGAVARKLTPQRCHYRSMWLYDVGGEFDFTGYEEADLDAMLAFNNYTGRCMTALGKGANIAFGHGGPGEFFCRKVSQDDNSLLVEFETGAKAKIQFEPHFYHTFELPVKSLNDLHNLKLPDPTDSKRYQAISSNIKYLKEKGEYVVCSLNGFFSGVHYFLCDYEEVLMALVADERLMEGMLEVLGNWNIAAAEQLALCGADCVAICDDLGAKKSMLISPEHYRKFIKKWHKRLCEKLHQLGCAAHLHCHGAIKPILNDIADCGFDFVNPFDPEEGFDIEDIIREYSSSFVVVGGFPASFWQWDKQRQHEHLKKLADLGYKYGRFIFMDSGGVPEDVSNSDFEWILEESRRLRGVEDVCFAV